MAAGVRFDESPFPPVALGTARGVSGLASIKLGVPPFGVSDAPGVPNAGALSGLVGFGMVPDS